MAVPVSWSHCLLWFVSNRPRPFLGVICIVSHRGGAIYAPYGPFFAIITEILPQNVSGGAIGLINSFGALGSFVGAYLVGYLNGKNGGFDASYIFMASSLLLSALLTMIAVKRTKIRTLSNTENKEHLPVTLM